MPVMVLFFSVLWGAFCGWWLGRTSDYVVVSGTSSTKVTIDDPKKHGPHVDVVTPGLDIRGAHRMRIGPDGEILTEEVLVKGGLKTNVKEE
jgi:hypothetical protein